MTEGEVSELIRTRQKYLRECAQLANRIWKAGHDLSDKFDDGLGIMDLHEKDFVHGYARALQETKMPAKGTNSNHELPLASNTPSPPETKLPVER